MSVVITCEEDSTWTQVARVGGEDNLPCGSGISNMFQVQLELYIRRCFSRLENFEERDDSLM